LGLKKEMKVPISLFWMENIPILRSAIISEAIRLKPEEKR